MILKDSYIYNGTWVFRLHHNFNNGKFLDYSKFSLHYKEKYHDFNLNFIPSFFEIKILRLKINVYFNKSNSDY